MSCGGDSTTYSTGATKVDQCYDLCIVPEVSYKLVIELLLWYFIYSYIVRELILQKPCLLIYYIYRFSYVVTRLQIKLKFKLFTW